MLPLSESPLDLGNSKLYFHWIFVPSGPQPTPHIRTHTLSTGDTAPPLGHPTLSCYPVCATSNLRDIIGHWCGHHAHILLQRRQINNGSDPEQLSTLSIIHFRNHIPAYVIFVCKFLFDFGHEALTEALDKYMNFLTR